MCAKKEKRVKLRNREEMNIWKYKPRRISEIWKLEQETNTVVVLGLKGVAQLNAMGSAIWLQLDGMHTIGNIIQK